MKIDRPIAIALILFIILILVFFLVAPEYNTFKKLRLDLGEKKAQYNAEFDYYAEIIKKYHELKNREDDLKKINNALPENPDLGRVIYYFQKTAAENGMLIKDLFLSSTGVSSASGKIKNTGNIRELIFSIDVLGSYSSLRKFLSSLEKSDRIFEVTNISFGTGALLEFSEYLLPGSAPDQPQIEQIYNFSLQVKTHSY